MRFFFAALGVALVSTAAAAEDEPKRLLVMDIAHGADTKPDFARTITELITARIDEVTEFRTVSGAEIRNLVALEGEKHAVGCDDASCLAEIAGAMGASYVVFGRLSHLGQTLVLQLGLFDARAAEAVARETVKAANIDEIAIRLDAAVDELVGVKGPTSNEPKETGPAMDPMVLVGYGGLGLGALLAITGVAVAGVNMATTADKTQLTADRKGAQVGSWVGIVLAAVGVGVAGAGGYLAFTGGE